MPKRTLGRKTSRGRKAIYKKKVFSPKSLKIKQDQMDTLCQLTDNILLNNTIQRGGVLVNWCGNSAGVDSTFRLANSLEFSKNLARFRYYRVNYCKITLRWPRTMYEFDTARMGGILNACMASSPVTASIQSAVDAAVIMQTKDYVEISPEKPVYTKTCFVKSYMRQYHNVYDFQPSGVAYPDMFTAVRINGSALAPNTAVLATLQVQWSVSFRDRVPET